MSVNKIIIAAKASVSSKLGLLWIFMNVTLLVAQK